MTASAADTPSESTAPKLPLLRLQLFGEFHVTFKGEALNDGLSSRLKALLASLILQRGKPQSRQHLAFLLWPDSSEGQARTNLRHLIHSLRHSLPAADDFLRVDSLALEWRAEPISSDIAEFEEALTHENLEDAVALYRGDLLPSCYDDWIVPERERLRLAFLQALEQLIQLHEGRQEYNAAILLAQRLLQQDPLRETSYQRMMRLYALSGDRASVTRTFQICETVLQRELGVEPSESTREIYARLLRLEAPAASYTSSQPTSLAFDGPSPLLPIPLTSFIGRERQIAEVRALLGGASQQTNAAENGVRLLTLTGAGGCGKTRLALEVATKVQESEAFRDGVWFVELVSLADPALVAQTVAATFGVRDTSRTESNQSLVETLVGTLRWRKLLLVLDNCEHLIGACAQLVDRLLRACPYLHILATSRESLAIAGEIVWLVPSLEVPPAQALSEQIQEAEAVHLFVARATTALPTFRLTNHNAWLVAQICRQLDGIPLALELAAARVRVMSIEQLATRLAGAIGERFQLLSGGSRTAGRHQTLRAAINWSYDLLPENEQRLFRRLSVFAGGFTLEAAEAVCSAPANQSADTDDDLLNLLAHLVDKSLVVVDVERQPGSEVRYRLLETLRQYSRERLREAGEEGAIQERHALFFLTVVEAADAALNGPEELPWLNRLEAEHDNLREVLRWSEESHAQSHGHPQLAVKMIAVLWKFWSMRSYHNEGYATMRKVLAWPEQAAPTKARLHALNGASFLGQELGRYQETQPLLHESLAIATALGDQPDLANTLHVLAGVAVSQGDYEAARRYSEQGLAIRRQLGNAYETAQSLITWGHVPLIQEHYAEAQTLLEEGVALLRTIGHTNLLAYTLRQLARTLSNQQEYQRAFVNCRESLMLNMELQSHSGVIACLAQFVDIALAHGHPLRAARLAGAVETLLKNTGTQLLWIESDLYAANQNRLRTQFDPVQIADAWNDGQSMTLQEAVAYALEADSVI